MLLDVFKMALIFIIFSVARPSIDFISLEMPCPAAKYIMVKQVGTYGRLLKDIDKGLKYYGNVVGTYGKLL